jgi:flagellar L-ring protein precursor FlgH
MKMRDFLALKTCVLCFFLAAVMTGCATLMKGMPGQKHPVQAGSLRVIPQGEEVTPQEAKSYVYEENPYEGSLWAPQNSRAHLFMDTKARYINDILTVKIIEASDASRNAATKVTRKGGLKSKVVNFFGSPLDFGLETLWGKDEPFEPTIITESENDFNGAGTTIRKDKLIATITAKVVDVYPNGNMTIEGRREVTVNNEKQYIILSGIVRPEDISSDNVVFSTTIADAKITLSGKGVIADKQKPGWGHRVFDWLYPF